jgi:predicted enzyme related to lactoylglutathione lyase
MKLASIRLVTTDLERLITFYAALTGLQPIRRSPEFAEFHTETATLALSTERMVKQFNAGLAIAGANRSAIVEFEVEDVDAIQKRATEAKLDVGMAPTTMPWGNRSMLLKDPDGTVVNVFSRPTAR